MFAARDTGALMSQRLASMTGTLNG